MEMRMAASEQFKVSSSGLPTYRVQFIETDAETGQETVVSDIDIETSADCVKYINENPIIKSKLGFVEGETVETDLYEFVNRILYPYYPPEINQILNTSADPDFDDEYVSKDMQDVVVYKQKGTLTAANTFTLQLKAGSEKLTRCSFIRIQNNKTDVMENKILNLQPGKETTVSFRIPGCNNDLQYYFEVSDNENIVTSYKIDYKFILPIYVGYAKDGLLDPALPNEELNDYLNGLIKLKDRVDTRLVPINQEQKGFFDIVVDKDQLCPFIMVPLKWNSLMCIKDINGVDITKFYGHNSYVQLDTLNNNVDMEGYVIYVARKPIDTKAKVRYLRDITYTFAFDLDWHDLTSEGEQSEVFTGFDVLTMSPIDSRFTVETYDDLAYIKQPYIGLITFVTSINTYYKYMGNRIWVPTNTVVMFYNGKPSSTMGGKFDISIDIAEGDIYQKTNSNVWELKGNIRTGVTP